MTDYRTNDSGLLVPAMTATAGQAELRERIAELETGNDDGGEWLALGGMTDFEFSRDFLIDITRLARIMFIKNPIVGRGVRVKADYIYSRRVSIVAADEQINDVVQRFLNDERNQDEFSSHAMMIQREIELQCDGNIYFALMPHPDTGRVRIRTIPATEVADIIKNPNDKKERWYYLRQWIEKTTDITTGEKSETQRRLYYRDWRYQPDQPATRIGDIDVAPDVFVYHIKVGGFSDWTFGIPEIYSALDWARGYKRFLENWSSIVAAYARFAFKMTTTGGKSGVQAARDRLASTVSSDPTRVDRNPVPAAGSVYIAQQGGNDLEPIRTSGATTSAEDGRRLLLMVAAAFGLPETFFGDVSVGTLATATSLDKPTENMLSNRQTFWGDILNDILQFVLKCAISAPAGQLRTIGQITENEYGETETQFDDGIDTTIAITYAPLVRIDTDKHINAIVSGATFDGKTPSVIGDPKLLARMVLDVLGVPNVDAIVNRLYPDEYDPNAEPTDTPPPAAPDVTTGSIPVPAADAEPTDELAQATEALRDAIMLLREDLHGRTVQTVTNGRHV